MIKYCIFSRKSHIISSCSSRVSIDNPWELNFRFCFGILIYFSNSEYLFVSTGINWSPLRSRCFVPRYCAGSALHQATASIGQAREHFQLWFQSFFWLFNKDQQRVRSPVFHAVFIVSLTLGCKERQRVVASYIRMCFIYMVST